MNSIKTMRWVLIRPLNRSLFYDPEIQEPLGLEYLSATLKKSGCQVLLLDSALNNLHDIKLARRVASFQPDAIGFSITTDRELESVNAIYTTCKEILHDKQLFWIAGGNYATSEFNNACKVLPTEMHILKYEGEVSIKKICSLWMDGLIDTLPRVIHGEPAVLDELPFPERPYHHYVLNFGFAFNVQGSRGCCSACKYCASKGMRGGKLYSWRGRSPENMVSELAYLYQNYGARSFNFVDEDFLGPPAGALERSERFMNEIKKHNLKITIGIQVRPNSLSEKIIDNLYASGLTYVFMGIESDNPEDFKKWGRSFCKDTWQLVDCLQQRGIEINAGTLLFHPDCTFEGIRNFSVRLRQYGLLNSRTATNRLDAMPGSFFYEQYFSEHPEDKTQGVIRLPFKNPDIEPFFQIVREVLAPIEIPSMHALCIMPIIQTGRVFENLEEKYQLLKSINSDCDDQVSSCFFSVLEMFENDCYSRPEIDSMINNNIEFGKITMDRLIKSGFHENLSHSSTNLFG
ncbi:MAG: radical SAM protein [Tannerella sp.]|jgi:radical SAM superfamily enzyme YgiQ (UPF0313 family)|nr:radical SAM protein [Tannerella sp.]